MKLPSRPDGRTDDDKIRALLSQDSVIINEFNRRVAANIEARRLERIRQKWSKAS